jgi:peroxiredoxin
MHKRRIAAIAAVATWALAALPAGALDAPVIGAAAPVFTLPDSHGQQRSLGDFRGRHVVLEWVNYDCPFVGKHYGSGNMQKLQKEYTAKGVAWLSINSSAPGKQGNFPPDRINALIGEKGATPTAYLIDEQGEVGRAYGAKTTPHVFVIGPEGNLLYAGGIDDKPSTDQADIPGATNFVRAALAEALAGKPVSRATSPPYGCGVKY